MASDPLVLKILLRLRQTDAAAARRAERALETMLADDGGLADLTQHDLQTYLWFALADNVDAAATAHAVAQFFELAQMTRYAGIADSAHTKEIISTYKDNGYPAGAKLATKAMAASGVVPPDLPEIEWGEIMGRAEASAYGRITATLELAQAAGELKPGGRGWRLTQQRLSRQQLTMARPDGPPLLERVRAERMEAWADAGGPARRDLTSSVLADLGVEPPPPSDVADRLAPMQWALEIAAGRAGEQPGVPLTMTGNVARWVVQEAAERFAWWDLPERSPRSESDIWQLGELRAVLHRAGALRRLGRRLVLGPRGRSLLGDPIAQWAVATAQLVDAGEFEGAAQEAALLLLLRSDRMLEVHDLVRDVVDVLASSGWRDVSDGSPPDDRDVGRVVWSLVRRCELWSVVDEGRGPGFATRLRLSAVGRGAGRAALRRRALRPRTRG